MDDCRYIPIYYIELNCIKIYFFVHPNAGTQSYEVMCDIMSNKQLISDIRKMSTQHQTSGLESYRSVVNYFAPKQLAFSFAGMQCRYAVVHMLSFLSIHASVT